MKMEWNGVKMAEIACLKEITKLLGILPVGGPQQICLFHIVKDARGHILTNDTCCHSPGTPRKSVFFSERKRPKEGERVVLLGQFHERVGESPRQYKKFGASGSKNLFYFPK